MTGTVVSLEKAVSDPVSIGDAIVLIESMKMEIDISSTVSGVVVEMKVSVGDQVNEGQCVAVVREE
jgi:acetyl-CoA carboxylase biotin carboxyl carrier protein